MPVWVRNLIMALRTALKLNISEWPEADLAAVAEMQSKLGREIENTRDVFIQILSILGIWSMTLP